MDPIQATFEHGVFRPMTPVSLPDGCRVEISIVSAREAPSMAPSAENGGDESIEVQLRQIAESVSPESWQRLPADLSDRIDHYVYRGASE